VDPRVDDIAPDLGWDLPLRLLSGLHYLELGGEASWDDLDGALDRHADFLARWTAEQDVQTNEVQRSWALLPAFLSVSDGRPLDLLELGPSAGLNLVWDHYRYRYRTGEWGDGTLELAGDDRIPPPVELLAREVRVIRRRGVDLNPVDVTTERGSRLLQAFVWPDQEDRLERLRRAIDVVRRDPPQLMQGRLRRCAPVAPAESPRGRAADRLPDRIDDVPRPFVGRPSALRAPRGGPRGSPRLHHDRPRSRRRRLRARGGALPRRRLAAARGVRLPRRLARLGAMIAPRDLPRDSFPLIEQ
jgi:hypothetical protein